MKSCWNLRSSKNIIFVLLFFCTRSFCQFSAPEIEADKKSNEKDNYLFPIEPGTPNLLAGTMGELRSNHFHSGIDVRTGGKIGVPVLSAQSGYISRVSVRRYGYGNALYVTHPNGQTTVYGHLNHFSKGIADYVRKKQYQKKSLNVNLFFKPGTFDVARGDTIAFSGNSGGSSGPHLHFDIRNANNEALNPLEFKFEEIVDNTPPQVQKVALRTMDINSRINDQFGRFEFYVVKNGDNFILPNPISATGTIGIEILGHDRLDNTRSRCGINFIEALAGEKRVFRQTIDKVDFLKTRNILTLMDYRTMRSKGDRFNKLYISDGNTLEYYNGTINKGFIQVKEEEIPIRIVVRDTYGNQSLVNFKLRPSPAAENVYGMSSTSKDFEWTIQENTLIVKSKSELGDTLKLFTKKEIVYKPKSYSGGHRNIFLIDMHTNFPDSMGLRNVTVPTNFKDIIPSTISYTYYSDRFDLRFSHKSLYDTLYLTTNYINEEREVFSIGDPSVPLQKNISITLKPQNDYPEKSSVYQARGKNYLYKGGKWKNGKITFSTRNFGDFVILEDNRVPSIIKISISSTTARFKIRDDLSGISYFEGSINGAWLLMHYDYKTHVIWAERLDKSKPLRGELLVKVVDNAGNENIFQQQIP